MWRWETIHLNVWILLVVSHRGQYWGLTYSSCINDICKVSELLKIGFIRWWYKYFWLWCGFTATFDLVYFRIYPNLKIGFDKNKISLNLSKTKIMLFGKYKTNTQIQEQIDGFIIERIFENKFLGVTIDDNICWKPHISTVQTIKKHFNPG